MISDCQVWLLQIPIEIVWKRVGCVLGIEPTLEYLYLHGNQLTDVKGLEKLTKLTWLRLNNNKLADLKGLKKLIVHIIVEYY